MEVLDRKFDITNVKKDFKKVAWFYDVWGRITESKAIEKVIEYAGIKGGEKVLEIACGTGVVLEKLIKSNRQGSTIGIDLSPSMLDKARKRLKNIVNADYELKEGNVLYLEFQNNTFDIVINNFMVDLMPEDTFEMIAAEFFRILKPGGIVVVSTFSFGTKKSNRFWFRIAKNFPDLLTGCRPVSFIKYLTRAGFVIREDIEVSQNTFPSEVIKAQKTG